MELNQNASLLSDETKQLQSYLSNDERGILTALYVLLSLLGLLGNGVVIYVVISLRQYFDVPANIFILNQALSDFGTALSLCIYIVHMYIWIWDIFYWYTSVVWLASLGSLFLLTFNRLLSVIDSFSYPRLMTSTRAKGLVILNWILALVVTMYPLLIPWRSINTNLGRYYVVLITVSVIIFNIYLFREASIQSKKIQLQNRIVTGLQKNLKEDFKSVRTLAIVGGTFLVCCLPFTIVAFLYGDNKMSVKFQRNAAFSGIFMPLNAILDPVIYYLRSVQFRGFYQRLKRSWEGNRGMLLRSSRSSAWSYKVSRQIKPTESKDDSNWILHATRSNGKTYPQMFLTLRVIELENAHQITSPVSQHLIH